MKRFLCAGEGFALFNLSLKIFFAALILTTLVFRGWGSERLRQIGDFERHHIQLSELPPGKYKIGVKLRQTFVIGYDPFDHEKQFTLVDFEGKALILDIWSPGCTTCFRKFPILDSLQAAFEKDLEIILLVQNTKYPANYLQTFIADYKKKHPHISLRFLITDDPIAEWFSFRALPHLIWIDPNRRVRAQTGHEVLTADRLGPFILGSPLNFPIKNH